jgi:hypothetical protein
MARSLDGCLVGWRQKRGTVELEKGHVIDSCESCNFNSQADLVRVTRNIRF